MAEQERFVLRVGDRFTFGRYPQDAEGKEVRPVEWITLDVTDTAVLAVSAYILDAEAFDRSRGRCSWGDCDLREWLNGSFLQSAFTAAEQACVMENETDGGHTTGDRRGRTGALIRDRVFLLSVDECRRYLNVLWYGPGCWQEVRSFRALSPYTEYALTRFLQQKSPKYLFEAEKGTSERGAAWWLRSTFLSSGQICRTCCVNKNGGLDYSEWNHNNAIGIRPAILLDLTKADSASLAALFEKKRIIEEDPCSFSRIFPRASASAVRILDVPYPRHDHYNRFYVLWDRLLSGADGARYRCAASFSEAYDDAECFNIFLIPEAYDFEGAFDPDSTVFSWPHQEDSRWFTAKDKRIAVWVSPDASALAWQVNHELWYWHAPLGAPEETSVCVCDRLPDNLDLSDRPVDENGRVRLSPWLDCAWDIGKNLLVWQNDGKESFSDPETMFSGSETDSDADDGMTRQLNDL